MAKDRTKRRQRLERTRRVWITVALSLAGFAFLAFLIEADSRSEAYFGLTIALFLLATVPMLGFTMVRPVLRSVGLERVAAFVVRVFCGGPAIIGILTFLLFLGSIFPGGLGWEVQLGQDIVSYAPLMLPAAVGIVLATTLIARKRASLLELRFVQAGAALAGVLFFLMIAAFFVGQMAFVYGAATPAVALALAAFVFVVYRLYKPAEQQAYEALDAAAAAEEEQLSRDPWHALRRV